MFPRQAARAIYRGRGVVLNKRWASSGQSSSFGSTSLGLVTASSVAAAGISFYLAKSYYDRPDVSTPPSVVKRSHSIDRNLVQQEYGGKKEFDQALPELRKVLGEDGVSTDEEDLKTHGYSEWSTYNCETLPIAIVYPNSTEEVSAIAKVCHKYKLPMIGYSGGSSLEGNFSANFGGICIDFANMDKILEVRPDDMDCTVQPAVGWMDLNKHLDNLGTGLFFAVDPGPTAKIGGMVNTSCSGTNCVRYGPMRNHVINLTVVLADGTIIKTKQRPKKSSAGYNLNHIFCGSEGTLGLVTEVTVKLEVVPQRTTVATCAFPTVRDATSTAIDVIKAGVPVHAVELMDDVQMWAVNEAGYTAKKFEEKPTLFFKFSGTNAYVDEQIEQTRELARKYGSTNFEFASNKKEEHQIWAARKEALWSLMALAPKDSKVYSTDVAVPMSKLADLVLATKKDIVDNKIFGSALGHVGDGNFHASIMYTDQDKEQVKKVAKNIVYNGLALEGTCTGEHGVGAGKLDYLADELGADAIGIMRTIKLALDPHELLNPGKIFTKESIQRRIDIENQQKK
jgi:D-lactate dehydrogenase (cytochrome)